MRPGIHSIKIELSVALSATRCMAGTQREQFKPWRSEVGDADGSRPHLQPAGPIDPSSEPQAHCQFRHLSAYHGALPLSTPSFGEHQGSHDKDLGLGAAFASFVSDAASPQRAVCMSGGHLSMYDTGLRPCPLSCRPAAPAECGGVPAFRASPAWDRGQS